MFEYPKPDNLVDLFENAILTFADNKLFGVKNTRGDALEWMTYREVGQRVDFLRGGFVAEGIKPGDTIGFIGNNRPEWAITAFAAYGAGARFVPMYEAELPGTWEYIIKDSGIRLLIVSKPEIYRQIKEFSDRIPTLERIYVIETREPDSMAALERLGKVNPVASVKPAPENIAALVYTSGTTGEPKGVLLSHGNFTSNAICGGRLFSDTLNEDSRSISILPWAHAYGQVAELYNWLMFGGSIGFMESVNTLADDLALIRPTFIIAVPRVFNKIYDGLWTKMNETGGMAKKLFVMGLENARKKRELAGEGKSIPMVNLKCRLADKIVFQKIRNRFGGRVKGALTASALMNVDIARFFGDIGIPIFDCYGLSETSPAVTMNCFSANRPGSVGRPLEHVRVVIDKSVVPDEDSEDGEVVVYGPNVMQGYHNKPVATSKVITKDGGFRTGDRGRIDEDGFLFITGRLKEQYKLENGKYVFPGGIEEDIRLVPLVANAMLYGEGRAYNVCLVVPDFEVLGKYAQENGLKDDPQLLINDPDIQKMIRDRIVSSLKPKYGGYEIPKKFVFIADDFSVDNGMLTQTLKLKRRVVMDKYRPHIESLYQTA